MNDNNFRLRKKNSYENNCRMKTKQKKKQAKTLNVIKVETLRNNLG